MEHLETRQTCETDTANANEWYPYHGLYKTSHGIHSDLKSSSTVLLTPADLERGQRSPKTAANTKKPPKLRLMNASLEQVQPK